MSKKLRSRIVSVILTMAIVVTSFIPVIAFPVSASAVMGIKIVAIIAMIKPIDTICFFSFVFILLYSFCSVYWFTDELIKFTPLSYLIKTKEKVV